MFRLIVDRALQARTVHARRALRESTSQRLDQTPARTVQQTRKPLVLVPRHWSRVYVKRDTLDRLEETARRVRRELIGLIWILHAECAVQTCTLTASLPFLRRRAGSAPPIPPPSPGVEESNIATAWPDTGRRQHMTLVSRVIPGIITKRPSVTSALNARVGSILLL